MADPAGRLRAEAGTRGSGERDNIEENAAQRQSDAAPDADGEQRRKLYEQGATLVSRID